MCSPALRASPQQQGGPRCAFEGIINETQRRFYYARYRRSGTYGTVENRVGNKISKEGGGKSGKWRYIFNRFFPTMEQVKYGNPFFYRHKILLPFLMPYRLLRGVLKRRAHLTAELKALKKF